MQKLGLETEKRGARDQFRRREEPEMSGEPETSAFERVDERDQNI